NLDARQQLFVDTINRSGSALLTIINDVLDFSKVEAGRLELDPTPFNLQSAVEDVVALMTSKAQEKQIELAFRYAPDLPQAVVGDVGRIRQIVTNLVGNAVKFTHQGFVYLDVSGSVTDGEVSLLIAVQDTGIGIAEDKLDLVFEKFAQAETSTTRQYGGTGLGLAISKRLAEAMDGTLVASSRIGEGSTFTFTLSLPVTDTVVEDAFDMKDIGGTRALIVDDLLINRRIVVEQLEMWGLRPKAVDSGQAALKALATADAEGDPYELAVIDYHMPRMDGADLVEAFKLQRPNDPLKIVVLSSDDTGASQQRFRKLGVDAIRTKPVRSSVLKDAIALSFAAKLPFSTPSEETEEVTISDAEPEVTKDIGRRKKILVAEDNDVNRLVIKSMLGSGYELFFAHDGKEAYDLYQTSDFDLVLMDLSMPNMDGYEATQAIRAYEAKNGMPRTPIVCLTAHVREREREASRRSGMDDYLSKPVKRDALLGCLDRWLDGGARTVSDVSAAPRVPSFG
ncbi:MAG: response regulator, partial [Pseudomonadota bacterium]